MNKYFKNTTKLMGLNFRQNRVFTMIWLFFPAVWLLINSLSSLVLFPNQAALEEMGVTLIDPITVSMHGPLLDISVAGFVTWRTRLFATMLMGIFSLIYVVRHTRAAEEQGKRELLGSNVVGCLSPLFAALCNMLIVNFASSVMGVVVMISVGFGFIGSLAHMSAIFLSACFFGVLGGLFAQIFASGGAARGATFGGLALLHALHMMINITQAWGAVTFFSPLEWSMVTRPFANERFLPLIIPVIMIMALATLSLYIMKKRDMGSGLLAQKAGRTNAKPGFCTIYALSIRTQKGMFLMWLIFFAVFSFALGSVSYLMSGAVSNATALAGLVERLGGADKALMTLILYVFSMLMAVYAIMSVSALRREEADKGELLLSLPLKRKSFMLSHLLFVFGGSAIIALVSGACVGLGAAISLNDGSQFIRLFMEMAVRLPSIWAIGAVAVLIYGLLPKLANGINYAYIVLLILIEILWEQQTVSDALYAISPFSYANPLRDVNGLGLLGLCVVAVVLCWVGVWGFKRRDIAAQ